jgi:hypothetical protein
MVCINWIEYVKLSGKIAAEKEPTIGSADEPNKGISEGGENGYLES